MENKIINLSTSEIETVYDFLTRGNRSGANIPEELKAKFQKYLRTDNVALFNDNFELPVEKFYDIQFSQHELTIMRECIQNSMSMSIGIKDKELPNVFYKL